MLSGQEKELIITCLGNSLADGEQSDIHGDVTDLYTRLLGRWNITGHHTAKEIIDINGG